MSPLPQKIKFSDKKRARPPSGDPAQSYPAIKGFLN
jgi:hypothetical protein